MKTLILFAVLFFAMVAFAETEEDIKKYSAEHNVTCEKMGFSTCTLMYCGGPSYINGTWTMPPKCNTCTSYYKCSDGKEFIIEEPSY